ncbi:UBX domain-containing 1 [Lecanosticta acicola]|uniref:UBX domain-containing 1 n=1 Tax=Lecanosticta acicola TaxID=111012 RepID=A0AAI8YW74_9PEZI|nr:UBX domain-containing 1 [Lecanosticta acicola]
MDASQNDMVAEFSAITGANPSVAQTALASANWNLGEAVGLYFAANDEQPEDEDDDADGAPSQPTSSQPAASSSSSKNQRGAAGGQPKKMKTLRDLQAGGDDDEDEEERKKHDMFAGGEKSGLAVQNPDGDKPIDHFRNIMNQARQNRDRPGATGEEEEEEPGSSHFIGRAQTLGGDDAPSEVVEDPRAVMPQRQRLPRVTRTLHLWADGVSIDDGPLYRFDDPQNEHIMQEINQGRAPKALLDVQPDQEVDLNLEPHKGENYVTPKPKYKPFGGSGQRLGSPTPGLASSSSAAASSSAAPAAAPASSSSSTLPVNVDESQPTVQLRVTLGDGTRLTSRFNTTHTIGDVYSFVERASPASQQRAYVLQTTFPPKEFSDKTQTLGDISDFKRGGVLVQKWK